jgi:bifunctional DNA-binding transcriptional regulator/antitoxin component of YhaV-PrlF toxin-antitoxin module
MLLIGAVAIDAAGRLSIRNFLQSGGLGEKDPKAVTIAVETEDWSLRFAIPDGKPSFAREYKIDSKGRVAIPPEWRRLLGDVFYVIIENGEPILVSLRDKDELDALFKSGEWVKNSEKDE